MKPIDTWECFETETGLPCKALITLDGYCVGVKIATKVPRGFYYSFLNDALEVAAKKFKFKE